MRYLLCSFILFLSYVLIAEGQSGSRAAATVSGKVADSSTDDPMGAATITVTDRKSGELVTGALTNTEGDFEIPAIPYGLYDIKISFIGYDEVKLDSLEFSDDHPVVSLGTIHLSSSNISLGEVNVISERPVVENKFDKIVYNVSGDVTSQGSLAIDVLRKVPQVTVDAEGNVELQGNSNIKFLINGKESSIFGNNLADALASIPASQIKTIEAIANPGAKYDLQGTGGIINIILQDNKMQGASGNVNVSAGTRNQTGSVNLGIKRGNFGVNGYFSGNWRLGTDGNYYSVRDATDSLTGIRSSLTQEGVNRFERNGYRAGLGFELDITKKLHLSGNAGYNNFSFGSSGLVNITETGFDISGNPVSGLTTIRNFTNNRETTSVDWNLDLKKRFAKEGHELDFVFNSSYGKPESYYLLTLSDFGNSNPSKGSESNNPGTDNTITATIDYTYPFSESSTLEAGFKGTFNDITSLVNVSVFNSPENTYTFDPLQSYNLGYKLNVYAGYVSAGFSLFKWLDIKPGARYEYSDISIDYPGASVPSYGTLVPSILLSHNFSQNKSLQFTYSRRIRRPGYNDLNPFINRSDPYNIETGNILLKPEVGERFELGYNMGFGKGGNLKLTLSQGIDSREIERLTAFYPQYMIGDSLYRNVSVATNENIGSDYNTGFNLYGSIPVTSKFSLRTNLMVFYGYLMSNQSQGNITTGFRFRGNLNASWQLPEKFMLELFGFWRSGGKNIQGREPQFYIYNVALRKLFWNDKGSLGFVATNVLRKDIRQVTTITTDYSASKNVRELPFRSFGVSFTYKFGKMQNRPDRNNEEDSFGGNGE